MKGTKINGVSINDVTNLHEPGGSQRSLFSENLMQFSHLPNKCAENYPGQDILKLCYVIKKRAKNQNTKLRIQRGTIFGQWKKYVYSSKDIGPLNAIDSRCLCSSSSIPFI